MDTQKFPAILRVRVSRDLLEKNALHLKHLFTNEVEVNGIKFPNLVSANFMPNQIQEAQVLYERVRYTCNGFRNWFGPEG